MHILTKRKEMFVLEVKREKSDEDMKNSWKTHQCQTN